MIIESKFLSRHVKNPNHRAGLGVKILLTEHRPGVDERRLHSLGQSCIKKGRKIDMKKLTLGSRLTLGGVMLVVVPLVIIGLFAVMKASDALTELSGEQAAHIAENLADMTAVALSEEIKLTKELSMEKITTETAAKVAKGKAEDSAKDIDRLNRHLADVMKQIGGQYEAIVVVNPEGVVFADGSNGEIKGLNVADRDYFKAARDGKAGIGTVVKSRISGNPVVPICVPLLGEGGEFVGSIATILKIDFLVEKIAGTKLGRTGYAFMLDGNGRVIAHPKKEFILEMDMKNNKGMEAIVSSMLAHKAGVESYVYDGVSKIAGFAPVKLSGWSVAITQPTNEFLASAHAIRNGILLVGVIFLGFTIVLVFFFARSISRPITRVVDGLNEGAYQVSAASAQVSASSQSLAEGASEQAASIEETSSSLEEMSSMTKQNAAHANEANNLMAETSRVVSRANNSMGGLTASMAEISKASEETSKIIKTIDEIAFQTNLLALNAAVEAARAGEAGAGFAVVADEVRNLAMRAADAAKNTANLIEGTVAKIKEGSEIVGKTGTEFLQVAASAEKMSGLVGEIAAASNEQAQGIEQINKAVSEMDKVVQQNAANAEESAAASQEMNAQAAHMKGFVEDLVAIVGGTTNGAAAGKKTKVWNDKHEKVRNAPQPGTATTGGLPTKITSNESKGNRNLKTASMSTNGRSGHLIPFDEAEVGDF